CSVGFMLLLFVFFFQAEDGIRDFHVTGVQTCALPISLPSCLAALRVALAAAWGLQTVAELMGSEAGMGRAIAVRTGTGDVASVMALILILGIVAVLADLLFTVSTRKVLRWQ